MVSLAVNLQKKVQKNLPVKNTLIVSLFVNYEDENGHLRIVGIIDQH
jgi:hypothetical protein